MKASDIPDEVFLNAIRDARAIRARQYGIDEVHVFVSRWNVGGRLGPMYPEKVVLAKARKLIKRQVIDGCACGCRGEFQVIGDR